MKKFERTISDFEKKFRELDRVKEGSFERVINGMFEDALGQPHGLTGDEDQLAITLVDFIRTTYREEIRDVLGTIYMRLDPKREKGQFFTQHDVCFDRTEYGFLTVTDPTCGSGNMLLAAANFLDGMGIDIRNEVVFLGSDIDPICVKMTAIQLGILDVTFNVFSV